MFTLIIIFELKYSKFKKASMIQSKIKVENKLLVVFVYSLFFYSILTFLLLLLTK
jgi:hypothetical protein